MIERHGILGEKQLKLDRLSELEAVIDAHLPSFLKTGRALVEIYEQRYYLELGFTNFGTYCESKWGWSKGHVHRLMDAAKIAAILSVEAETGQKMLVAPDQAGPGTDDRLDTRRVSNLETPEVLPLPKNLGQYRELAPVKDDPAAVRAVYRRGLEEHGDALTGSRLAQVRRQMTEATSSNPKPVPSVDDARREADKMRRDCLDAIRRVAPLLERINPETRVPYLDGLGMAELETLAAAVESWLTGVRSQINEFEPF